MTKKRHNWMGGVVQTCKNDGCDWHRLWLPSKSGDGETQRRPEYHHDNGWVQRRTPECGSKP